MTLEEAKKILEKEGFHLVLAKKVIYQNGAIREFEKPEVFEAIKVANANRWTVGLSPTEWDEREARLKKEYRKNTKTPGEEQPEGNKVIIYPSPSPKADFYYKHVLNEGNPALAESASQFNDALLYEQSKKIKRLTEKIARLDKIIHKKYMKIEELRKESSRHLRGKVKLFGETVDLLQELCDKNEDLRLSKICEKNLTEVCQKYAKENEKLKKKLAAKIVDKIDAQALKSAESALAYKEKVIAEKDEVIADLCKELAATKKELEEKTQLVEMVRKGSKEYCEYGIAAEKMIRKMANVIVYEGKVSSKEFEEYRRWANGYRFNPQLYDFIEEEVKKLNAVKMVDINAKCMRAARESINDVFESYAAKYAKSSLDDLKAKAYELFNAKAHNLGLVGSKDGNGIIDQMEEKKKLSLFRDDSVGAVTNQKDCSPVKDTHHTEDNPEEIEMDELLEYVRKALEKGYTVSIDYDKAEEGGDQSATIVECGKDIDDVFEEIKRLCQE